ncbi:MAG TPA: hypothetical protein ENJ48_02110 [Anaerolineae bacterium]|nr:hypothetical protein [Anaerolineae bacterium]
MMMGFGMGIWGILLMVLFWGGLVALVVWLVGLMFPAADKRPNSTAPPPSAEEILKIRFARGEITADEYKRMQETLQANQ